MQRLKSFLAKAAPLVVVALAALTGGYFWGRHSKPSYVVETTNTHVHEEVREAEKITETTGKTEHRVTRVHRKTYRPDGTVASETTKETGQVTNEVKTGMEDRHTDTVTDGSTTHTRVERRDSGWRLTALLGAQLQNPARGVNLLVGVNAERRILGPVWAGVFVAGTLPAVPNVDLRRQGALFAGVSLSFQF